LRSRALALLLAALVATVLFELAVAPLWSAYRTRQEAAEQLALELRSYSRAAAVAPQLRQLMTQVRAQITAEQLDLGERSPALASAGLQQRLSAVADDAGALLLSTQVLPHAEEGAFQRVSARVHIRTDVEALPKILHAIESGFPYLFVDNIQVATRGVRSTAAQVVRASPLDLNLEVSGYLLHWGAAEQIQGSRR
jgi:general secretion pathway protein M